jgi:ABC-2 type transport system ATP-binding protein
VSPTSRAHALAERFGADLSRPLRELSRGNRQKIGLVQAFFHDPELLVLDEPTAGLDPLMQEEFLSVVGEHRERGGTVFLSSHDLDEVERVCDRVGIIRDGRLIAVDDVAQMRDRAYREVVVSFERVVDPREIAAIAGVREVEADGTTLRFRVHGDLDPLVKALARHACATSSSRGRRSRSCSSPTTATASRRETSCVNPPDG